MKASLREAVFERDNWTCQGPARGLPGRCWGTQAPHHVLPKGRGGRDHEANLVTLCFWHHTGGGPESVHGNTKLAYELGLLQRSGDTPCAACQHVERLHARGGQCTYGPELGHECPCNRFIDESEAA